MASTIKLKNGSGAPTSGQLVQGEPALDLTNKRLYTENASGTVIEVGTNPSSLTTASADINGGTIDGTVIGGSSAAAGSFTTISASGEIAANGGIALGDNDKATFGASDDLQIYHDGSNSYVQDAGSGYLVLGKQDTGTAIQNSAGQNLLITSANDVTLAYQNSAKLATTSTGIDVTGTVTADGLTVDGTVLVQGTQASPDEAYLATFKNLGDGGVGLNFDNSVTSNFVQIVADVESTGAGTDDGVFRVRNAKNAVLQDVLRIDADGDLSLFEDTGTTAKFFWDASAESLSVPTLSITDGSITTTAAAGDHTVFNSTGADADFRVRTGANTHSLYVEGNTGNVGIGTSSPSWQFHCLTSGAQFPTFETADGNDVAINLVQTGVNTFTIGYDDSQDLLKVVRGTASSTTGIGIDSSGNVGIGTASPAQKFVVSDNGGAGLEFIPSTTNDRTALLSYDRNTSTYQTFQVDGSDHRFFTSGSEKARIDSSGILLVGYTAADGIGGSPSDNNFSEVGKGYINLNRDDTATARQVQFGKNGVVAGYIETTGSTTSYNITSDRRLKDNIVDAPSASDDIDAIQVRSFDWKADGSHQKYGMVAQELMNVAPEAVSGDPDSDEIMGVDYSKLVPMMMKEIQSLRARVAQLEGVN